MNWAVAFMHWEKLCEKSFMFHLLIQEYHVLISKLEGDSRTENNFTLQTLWYYLSPSIETFGFLDQLINSLCKPKGAKSSAAWKTNLPIGGALLTFLSELIVRSGGNPVSKKLYSHLLQNAYNPFAQMLNQWVCCGELKDTYAEFMIRERSIKKEVTQEGISENYWDRKYYIEDDAVPVFLMAYQDKILVTGKYLNVLKECGIKLSIDSNDSVVEPHTNEALDILNGSK